MKKLILFAVICIGAASCYLTEGDYGYKLKTLAKKAHDFCVEKTGVTQTEIERVQQGKFDDEIKIKEYTGCLWTHTKAMNGNFELDEELIKDTLPVAIKDVQFKVITDCRAEIIRTAGADMNFADKAYSLAKCVHDRNPESWFFF
ncbi:general odorant-binding protein 83a isoform X1 [Diorhabda carinulata]|uniref:general odorant-binding protein 83a isoform X1 n=1 Tax=Diorhabda carinulata TaxID=1163345 RepID=UPI00259FE781|nr:general odorant-binding protein 83a isoform X1 [Diorhabda carinulata]